MMHATARLLLRSEHGDWMSGQGPLPLLVPFHPQVPIESYIIQFQLPPPSLHSTLSDMLARYHSTCHHTPLLG